MPNTSPGFDTIFSEAIEIADESARASYLDQVCGSDFAIRHRLESLISAHLKAGRFLESPIPGIEASPSISIVANSIAEDDTGTVLGHYSLLEKIGEGGMGAVYVAEQTHPLKRRVALKLIRPGMDSKEVVARFNAERQALALMDHPNIARVLDAGTANTGRPYFVMELVRGLPITEYCDQARLNAAQRLALFVQICRAVQHAHQKGVIHRDIKPTNVMITLHDGVPVPKVIDFGIAKAVNQPLTDGLVYTRLTQLVGTPMYMSPEQAELSGLDIDTRSDVYSLGVLLYELLTGTTPFDEATLKNVGFDEMRRMIREVEPPRPSQRISTLDATARSTVSSSRGVDDRQLCRMLTGDLDLIVMKSLEKDRNRRYESANEFAADIGRYLNCEPVLACPPTKYYRFRRFVLRNKVVLATATVVFLAVMAAAAAIGWAEHSRSSDRAEATRRAGGFLEEADKLISESRWSDAYELSHRAEVALGESSGSWKLRQLVQERKKELSFVLRLQEIRMALTPLVIEADRAGQGNKLYASAFQNFGIDIESLAPQEATHRLPKGPLQDEFLAAIDNWILVRYSQNKCWKGLLDLAQAADSDAIRIDIRTAWAKSDLDKLIQLAADADLNLIHPNTIQLLQLRLPPEDAVTLLQKAQRRWPGDFWLNLALGQRLAFDIQNKQPVKALPFFRAAVAIRPNSPHARLCFAEVLFHSKEYDEAIEMYRAAIRLKPDYAEAYNRLGHLFNTTGSTNEAVAAFREAIRLDPKSATALNNLGNALYKQKHYSVAIVVLREAIRLDPDLAVAYHNLGTNLARTGAIEESIESFHNALRLDPNNGLFHNGLGAVLCDHKKDFDGAIIAFRRVLELHPDYNMIHFNLGKALAGKGELDAAADAYREFLRRNPNDENGLANFGELSIHMRSWQEAENVANELKRLYPKNAKGYSISGNVRKARGDHDGAYAFYRQALEFTPDDYLLHLAICEFHMRKKAWADAASAGREAIRLEPNLAEAHCNVGHALRELGKYPEALEFLRRGHELGSKKSGWNYPSSSWVNRVERLVSLGNRLDEIIAGTGEPPTPDEAAIVAVECRAKKMHRRAAELYKVAFTESQGLNDRLKTAKRFDAVCSAVAIGCALSDDATTLEPDERKIWRMQTLSWLRDDLAKGKRFGEAGSSSDRSQVAAVLASWQTSAELAPVREPIALAKLPDNERAEWIKFWADVQTVIDTSRPPDVKQN